MPDESSAATEHALLQEITAPLRTLPDDARALVQADFPTSMRGYDRHAVDDYVDQVIQLVDELQSTRSPEAAVRRALERVGEQISGILQRAHETAEQVTAQSRAEAEDRLEQARREAATMIDAAERRVRELDADTDRVWAERQRILADAEVLSGELLTVAREASARFPDEDTRAPDPGAADGAHGDEARVPSGVEGEPDEAEDDADLDLDDEDLDDEDFDDEDLDRLEEPEVVDGNADEPEDGLEDDLPGPTGTLEFDSLEDHDEARTTSRDEVPEVERTMRYRPEPAGGDPVPRRITDDDATQIIPPASDAGRQHRDD